MGDIVLFTPKTSESSMMTRKNMQDSEDQMLFLLHQNHSALLDLRLGEHHLQPLLVPRQSFHPTLALMREILLHQEWEVQPLQGLRLYLPPLYHLLPQWQFQPHHLLLVPSRPLQFQSSPCQAPRCHHEWFLLQLQGHLLLLKLEDFKLVLDYHALDVDFRCPLLLIQTTLLQFLLLVCSLEWVGHLLH
jgi:hypothetical protein